MTASTRITVQIRLTSRWMIGLIFFLLIASHVALPCAMATGHGGAARGGMCRENTVARTGTDTNQYFMAPMPKALEMATTVTIFGLASVAVLVPILSERRRTPLGVSARGRPFASSDHSYLPSFAATRDA